MNDDPVGAILSYVEAAGDLYHRLVLVVGPGGSGKTATLARKRRTPARQC